MVVEPYLQAFITAMVKLCFWEISVQMLMKNGKSHSVKCVLLVEKPLDLHDQSLALLLAANIA